MKRLSKLLAISAALLGLPFFAVAQDSRTVTEPTFPATCTTIAASLYISGGEPSSETAFDTSTIQTALNSSACVHKAVELVASGANNAFLIQPINIPSGVTLLVDAGVTVFASRNPADYQISGATDTCGTTTGSGGGCNPLITINGNKTSTGSGIMGYGVIDGRGGDYLIVGGVVQSYTWWSNAATGGGNQSNPVLMYPEKANTFTLYKITLINSPKMHVIYKNGNGFTAWDVKIITPYNAANTDGIDPVGSQNITITNSYISDGDDNVAVGSDSTSYPSSDITVSNNQVYGGHGISIGSEIVGTISNMLVDHINFAGTVGDPYATAIRLKSAADRGNVVSNVTYQNICIQNVRYPLQLNPFYNSTTSTAAIPTFNVALHNVNVLEIPTNAKVELEGHDGTHLTNLTLDNVVFPSTLTQSQFSPIPEYITINLGPGPVEPSLLRSQGGTDVTYTGSITNPTESPYDCTNAYVYLAGELFGSDASVTNQQTLTETAPATFNLNAVLEPTVSGSAAPTANVNFYEGTTLVGSAALGSNGTLATVTLTGVTAGVHTYNAQYPGDSNYPALTFGSVTVTVNSSPGYGMSVNPTALSVPGGTVGTDSVSLAPFGGFSGTINLQCGPLPAYVACTFNPATVIANGTNVPVTSTLSVSTSSRAAAESLHSIAWRNSSTRLSLVPIGGLCLLFGFPYSTLRRPKAQRLLSVLLVAQGLGITGCGSGVAASPIHNAAPGSSTLIVTASGNGINRQTSIALSIN